MHSIADTRAIATTTSICDRIQADELTSGDIIKHFTGDTWLVVSEPEYTNSGITFDVMWLDVDSPDNTQSVCFSPHWRFELVTHQSPVKAQTVAA